MYCPCKINLGLTVGPRLASKDGLHQIYSLFLPIRLGSPDPGPGEAGAEGPPERNSEAAAPSTNAPSDPTAEYPSVKPTPLFRGDSIHFETADQFIFSSENLIVGPDSIRQAFDDVSERGPHLDKNLMMRAVKLLQQHRSEDADQDSLPRLSIQLQKRIPPGTGVGAGSANAALILLYGVNQNWISMSQARALAPELGADVTFFLDNTPALVEGTGERISPVKAGPVYGVLCFPGLFVSTAEAYSRLKRPLQQSEDAKLGSLLSDSDWHAIAAGEWSRLAHWTNDFELPVFEMHPELAGIKESMVQTGADYSSLSGSGSALYGLYSSGQRAIEALDSLKSQYPELPFETFALWD